MTQRLEVVNEVTIRFAGDSGDGMQITGDQFTNTSALVGNDLSTLPDFPAEIRAPAGTLAGVSSFQVHFSSFDIHTPGDSLDVLVAMNPAALKVNLGFVKPNGIIIANTAQFVSKNLRLAGYAEDPLQDGSLASYQVFPVNITELTAHALADIPDLTAREIERCKNFFALGIVFWLFHRPMEHTIRWIEDYFTKRRRPKYVAANVSALKGGAAFAEATELFATTYEVRPAPLQAGLYRNLTGNTGLALGLLAAATRSGLQLFYAGYPITPASAILHDLSGYKRFGVRTFQAEDEIAAAGAALGAAYGGALAVTGTSGPGIALKQETISLAVSVELPMVICNVQRGGPSTGLPTKTEQSDLFQAIVGRHGEAPLPVIAASRPSDCFDAAFEACRVAIKYMTPVILLSDGYIGQGSEPWRIPSVPDLPKIDVPERPAAEGFAPYLRDPDTYARPWAVPGSPGLEHRVGGLEKSDVNGHVSYAPDNHETMTLNRSKKVALVAREMPPLEVHGDPDGGKLLVLGWGSTYGAIRTAVERCREAGQSVSRAHLRWLNPLPEDLGDTLAKFERVLIPELNLGQLLTFVRAKYLIPAIGLHKVQGVPFTASEIQSAIEELL
ncbi:2-oxoacid:acceptor oxidoreductase subunit alpha [Candidatus Poribacteria bacterium]|nr:2-oxoacid:acceptor oxidoreductase subunit alpha [Candidatus Poribacteria bacterium]